MYDVKNIIELKKIWPLPELVDESSIPLSRAVEKTKYTGLD